MAKKQPLHIKAVLHPIGKGEVLLTKSTRGLFSYWDNYVPEIIKRGIKVGGCECVFCKRKRI